VQTALQKNPFSGHVFVFRGRRGHLIKLLWWDGDGLYISIDYYGAAVPTSSLKGLRLCGRPFDRPANMRYKSDTV
jgi:hypothetical protein